MDIIERLREPPYNDIYSARLLEAAFEIERLRAALKEALDFIESDGCGGNVLVQRLRPLTG